MPPKNAPVENAVSLVVTVLMPSDRHAISSSRIASHARPIGSALQPRRHPVRQEHQREHEIVHEEEPVERRRRQAERARRRPSGSDPSENPKSVGLRNPRDAGVATRDRNPVDQHEAHDLGERERDDGEVVAPETQDRKPDHEAPEGSEDAGQRQREPERETEGLGEQRRGIGADRIEGDEAEVQEPREADDDIQAETQAARRSGSECRSCRSA